MEFKFTKFKVFIFTMLFVTIGIFGTMMRLEGRNFDYDAASTSPDASNTIERTEKTIFVIPGADIDSGKFWPEFTLWERRAIDVPWVYFNFNFNILFPGITNGFNLIQDELSGAPMVIQILLYAVPIVILLLIISSVVIGI